MLTITVSYILADPTALYHHLSWTSGPPLHHPSWTVVLLSGAPCDVELFDELSIKWSIESINLCRRRQVVNKGNVVLVVPTIEVLTPLYANVVRYCADKSGAWPCKRCTLKPRSRTESNIMFYCVDG